MPLMALNGYLWLILPNSSLNVDLLVRISLCTAADLLHLESGKDLLLVDLWSVHSSGSGLGL